MNCPGYPPPDTKKLKQCFLSLWFEGDDPLQEAPESTGIQCATLEETIALAREIITRHWEVACGCQEIDGDARARIDAAEARLAEIPIGTPLPEPPP